MSASTERSARLFFALLPDSPTRARVAGAAGELPPGPGAKLVPSENYHVTLAFIGDVPATQLAVVREVGKRQRANAFTLRFDAYEYWPKPEVVVAAARVIPTGIERLWQDLHHALAAHRWALAPKRLRPHVTLARKVSQAPVLQALSAFDWSVTEFSLMCSDTSGIHSGYTVVDTWPLLYDSVKT